MGNVDRSTMSIILIHLPYHTGYWGKKKKPNKSSFLHSLLCECDQYNTEQENVRFSLPLWKIKLICYSASCLRVSLQGFLHTKWKSPTQLVCLWTYKSTIRYLEQNFFF